MLKQELDLDPIQSNRIKVSIGSRSSVISLGARRLFGARLCRYADWKACCSRSQAEWRRVGLSSIRELEILVHRFDGLRRLTDHGVEALGDFVGRDVLHLDLRGIRLGAKLRIGDKLGQRIAQDGNALGR